MGPNLTVLDSQALVAALVGEPAAQEVEGLLRDVEAPPSMAAANLAEVIDVLVRRMGHGVDAVTERIAWLEVAGLTVRTVDGVVAWKAGSLRARHYDRSDRPLSMADCIALATALTERDALATSDPALAAVARAEGCRVVALPDSRGRRP